MFSPFFRLFLLFSFTTTTIITYQRILMMMFEMRLEIYGKIEREERKGKEQQQKRGKHDEKNTE